MPLTKRQNVIVRTQKGEETGYVIKRINREYYLVRSYTRARPRPFHITQLRKDGC